MIEGLQVIAQWSVIIPWIGVFIFVADPFLQVIVALRSVDGRVKRLASIVHSLTTEILPWMVAVSTVRAANYLVQHKWSDALIEGIMIVFWIWQWHRNDDDRWKKRRRKLTAKVKQLGSRLVVADEHA